MGWYTQERIDLRFKKGDIVYSCAIGPSLTPTIGSYLLRVLQVRTAQQIGTPCYVIADLHGWDTTEYPNTKRIREKAGPAFAYTPSLLLDDKPRMCVCKAIGRKDYRGKAVIERADYLILWPLPDLEWLEMIAAIDGEEGSLISRLWSIVVQAREELGTYTPRKEHADKRLQMPLLSRSKVGPDRAPF